MIQRILITMLVSFSILTGGRSVVRAGTPNPPEYRVKAACLYHFAQFVEWPPGAFKDGLSPIDLCILGIDPFGETLASISDKMVRGRRLCIKRMKHVDQVSGAHILFISVSESQNLSRTLKAVRNLAVLTVGEMDGFAQRGGMINFITLEKRVQFEINPDAVQRSGLKISSQLLKVAKIVTADGRRENE